MRLLTLTLAALSIPVGCFVLADRPLGELVGFTRAGAQVTVDQAIDRVPVEVRDRKLDNDVEQQQRELNEHHVALSLSRREMESLRGQIDDLEQRSERRERLLGEAYPALQKAMADAASTVEFGGSVRTVEEFQADVDQLLAEHEREAKQLEIRRNGLGQLERSVAQGEAALTEMRESLLALAQEIDLLRSRREQAELEARTIDLVGSVSDASAPSSSAVATEVERLRQQVDRLEAGNVPRRGDLPGTSQLNRTAEDWERLERLRAFQPQSEAPVDASVDEGAASGIDGAGEPAQELGGEL